VIAGPYGVTLMVGDGVVAGVVAGWTGAVGGVEAVGATEIQPWTTTTVVRARVIAGRQVEVTRKIVCAVVVRMLRNKSVISRDS
jgi:hypothetical protein